MVGLPLSSLVSSDISLIEIAYAIEVEHVEEMLEEKTWMYNEYLFETWML